jgi:hypothetical protein
MKIDRYVDIAKADLHERRRGGSTAGETDRHSDFVTLGM